MNSAVTISLHFSHNKSNKRSHNNNNGPRREKLKRASDQRHWESIISKLTTRKFSIF